MSAVLSSSLFVLIPNACVAFFLKLLVPSRTGDFFMMLNNDSAHKAVRVILC